MTAEAPTYDHWDVPEGYEDDEDRVGEGVGPDYAEGVTYIAQNRYCTSPNLVDGAVLDPRACTMIKCYMER